MKMKTLGGFLLLAFLSVGFRVGGSDPEEVEILLTDGGSLSGEILALRDTTIVVAVPAGLTEVELLSGGESLVMVLPHRQILNIQTEGDSYVLLGLGSGCAAGCLVGAAIGAGMKVESKEDDPFGCARGSEEISNTTTGAAVGSLIGSLVGLAVGGGASHSERVLVSPSQRDFNALRGVARYPTSEPEYLNSIIL